MAMTARTRKLGGSIVFGNMKPIMYWPRNSNVTRGTARNASTYITDTTRMAGNDDRRPRASSSPSGNASAMPATVAATTRCRPPQSSHPVPGPPVMISWRATTAATATSPQAHGRRTGGVWAPRPPAATAPTTKPSVPTVGHTVRVKPSTATTPSPAGQNRWSRPSARRPPVARRVPGAVVVGPGAVSTGGAVSGTEAVTAVAVSAIGIAAASAGSGGAAVTKGAGAAVGRRTAAVAAPAARAIAA